jgi:hypothetical protein
VSLPRLIVQALKLGIKQHSRYFLAGVLLLALLVFLSCGGAGALQSLLGPNKDAVPRKVDSDKPANLWELRKSME